MEGLIHMSLPSGDPHPLLPQGPSGIWDSSAEGRQARDTRWESAPQWW